LIKKIEANFALAENLSKHKVSLEAISREMIDDFIKPFISDTGHNCIALFSSTIRKKMIFYV